jgi:manganese/iron transport system permease protein
VTPLLEWIAEPLRYEFMRRALVEVVIMGAVTGIVGCYVVLRGLAFMGDALSHAIFPGIAIAFLLGQSIFLGALAFGVLTVVLIAIAATNRRVREDSAIGVLFAGMFALGVVLISSSPHFARDLASFLFGNVLGVTPFDIGLSVAVGALVLVLLALFHRALLVTSFDRAGAAAMGVPVFWLDLLLLLLIALTIVVSLSAVGNILVLAMLITPAATARLLTDRLSLMMGLSAALGAGSGLLGLFVSYHHDVAAGGTIVLVATFAFGIVWLVAPTHGFLATRLWARRRAAGRRSAEAHGVASMSTDHPPGITARDPRPIGEGHHE